MNNIVFETEHLRMVEFDAGHNRALVDLFNDEANTSELGFVTYDEASMAEMIEGYQADQTISPRWGFRMAVIRQEDDAFVGFADAHRHPGTDNPEIGFIIASDKTRRGYGTELAWGLALFALDYFKPDAVIAECNPDNIATVTILTRLGFELKEHRVKDFFNGREHVDTLSFQVPSSIFQPFPHQKP